MMSIEKLKAQLIELQEKLSALHTRGLTAENGLSEEDEAEFNALVKESEAIRDQIVAAEKRAAELGGLSDYVEGFNQGPQQGVQARSTQGTAVDATSSEFRNLGEWFEQRAMSMGNAGSGGVLVPEQFGTQLLSLPNPTAIVRPRATVIPAGTPPDAKITFPVFNQAGSNGIYGGMSMTWIDEGGTKADTSPEFLEIELEPKELGGSTIITDKLLRNAPALSAWLETQFRQIVQGKEDYVFLRGNGVGQPQGILGCLGEKTVVRNTASQVLYADVRSMLAAFMAESWGNGLWIANQTVLPYVINLVDAAGNTLFIGGDITKGIPSTLFGIPIIFTGKTPVLGSKGDLMLVDLKYYMVKDGSGPYFASSPHVYFTTNKTVVKMFVLVDGAPWVKSTLLLEDGSTTVSPFVVLV
jgi:HK97 family phage major capsid protein